MSGGQKSSKTAITLDTVLRLRPGARLKHDPVRGVTVLLLPETVVKLNDTSAAILSLMDGERPIVSAIECLRDDFEGSVPEQDVLEFLIDVASRGWVERV